MGGHHEARALVGAEKQDLGARTPARRPPPDLAQVGVQAQGQEGGGDQAQGEASGEGVRAAGRH